MNLSDIGSTRNHEISRRELLSLSAASLLFAGFMGISTSSSRAAEGSIAQNVKALTFDVFGTVVDWRTSIIREGELLNVEKGFDVDWASFADRWRSGYGPAMRQVRSGELPWTKIDVLHRMILDDLLPEFGITGLSEKEIDHLNRVWHRLIPWPDTVSGLNRLRSRYILSTLSNGNVSLLVNMAKNAGLPWDVVLSSELAGYYKTDLRVYQKAAELLSLAPEQIMMVAAHRGDLRAAASIGFRTAFVLRPLEYGPGRTITLEPSDNFDFVAKDFMDLATQLGT